MVDAIMWLVNDGTMCRKIIRISEQPSNFAAVIKSSVFIARNLPRTTLASSVHPIKDSMIVIEK